MLQWISSKSIASQYFWLNSARLVAIGNQNIWVWGSNGLPISYNWAAGQSNNFNGDSVYLNVTDNQFYVGLSSQSYASVSGFLCEAPVAGLSSNNLNILRINQTQAYSTTR